MEELRGPELIELVGKDPCFAMIPTAQEPFGKEDPSLDNEQAALVYKNTNGVLPDIYDEFQKRRKAKTNIEAPWHLDRKKEVTLDEQHMFRISATGWSLSSATRSESLMSMS